MFVKKMHDLMHNTPPHIAGWCPDGQAFYIQSPLEFERVELPQYFRGKRYASVVRQLHFHGFRQLAGLRDMEPALFSHPHFRQGARHLLVHVMRVTTTEDGPDTTKQVCFENALGDLRHDIDEIKTTMASLHSQLSRLSRVVAAKAAMQITSPDQSQVV
ncbi:hypothetical protein H310_02502 [Aphanomyces invadans]|uniref:HSF-type DNA-binding domain-containing protein n=1 Tax=Aphanomyces invadans TaxID=157072 RepID=A0A024UPP7_9STRA|nr:hypothetical protein H310_02502 [Aphanomyces invadans]ETW08165.1 hypothetical protein H310_02502 [Aphanomyces invadans]|eukprot:XP_008864258.1 hypothetical protein H310_02502 [Aphanomyces invadans]